MGKGTRNIDMQTSAFPLWERRTKWVVATDGIDLTRLLRTTTSSNKNQLTGGMLFDGVEEIDSCVFEATFIVLLIAFQRSHQRSMEKIISRL